MITKTKRKNIIHLLRNALNELNDEMASATLFESSSDFFKANNTVRQNFVNEIYVCQDLINRFEMFQLNENQQFFVVKYNSAEIYLNELKINRYLLAKYQQLVEKNI